MGLFERYLSLWIALVIVVGVVLGGLLPDLAAWIASLEVARINLPIAVLVAATPGGSFPCVGGHADKAAADQPHSAPAD